MAVTNNYQQADTGTKMVHIGKNTRSRIVSKGISAGHSQNSYRGAVKVFKGADKARNFSQCDSLLLGDRCGAHTFPYIEVDNRTARRARSHYLEDRRGSDLLLQSTGNRYRSCSRPDCERLCKEVFENSRWSSRWKLKSSCRQPGRQRRVRKRSQGLAQSGPRESITEKRTNYVGD